MHKRLPTSFILLSFLSLQAAAYGPYDYTNPEHYRQKLPIVENYHFNADVENLRKGMTSDYVASDLMYVLKVFPNHHRALNAMAKLWRLYEKEGRIPPGAVPKKTPDFFFHQAIQFAPKDATVRLLYGIYLHMSGKLKKAMAMYMEAGSLDPSSAEIHYNTGLLYFDMNNIKKAREHAEIAYNKKFPLQGLKQKLLKAGAWDQ